MGRTGKSRQEGTTSLLEKLAYAIGDGGVNFIWTFSGSFLTYYYTESALLAAGFVGAMMLVCRILDAFSDIAMGIIIEKTKTKFGKARPWFGLSIIPLAIIFYMVYHVPANLTDTGKMVYAVITYLLMTVIIYTANNLSFHAMLARISLTKDDRNKISSIRGIFAVICGLTTIVLTNIMLGALGGESSQSAWTTVVTVNVIIFLVCQIICFFGTREKIDCMQETEVQKSTVSSKEAFKALAKTKYFYLIVLIFISMYCMSNTGVAVYYCRDVLGNQDAFSLLAVGEVLPSVAVMPFLPVLFRKFGKKNVMLVSSIANIVTRLIILLNPYSVPVIMVSCVLGSLAKASFTAAVFTLAPDLVDYMENKVGSRIEGLATSATSFGMKVGTGFGAAVLGLGLQLGKYEAGAVVQPESAIAAEMFIMIWVPVILEAVRLICLALWDIDKKRRQEA